MAIRYHITVGARTTAGGTVLTGGSFFTIHGVPVAHEGDTVACPQCETVGVIAPDGARRSETYMGREIALSGDLCICQCTPAPRLIENQKHSWQQFDRLAQAAEQRAQVTCDC